MGGHMTEKVGNSAKYRNPEWLAHRYDPSVDAFHFMPVSRAEQGAATFLIDEHLPPGRAVQPVGRQQAVDAVTNRAPLRFIFHSAFCCSTLLARALDQPGLAMSLKEPVILNDLVGWRQRGGADNDVLRGLDAALTVMARPFGQGEAVVVKPSNVAAAFNGAMLDLRPDSRAILLYAPLRAYVGSVAKKGLWGRLWVRNLFVGLRRDGMIGLGLDPAEDIKLTDLQICAVGWLAQQALFTALLARLGPTRVRSLNSERLVADPEHVLRGVFDLFGWNTRQERVAAIAKGPEFSRHSKTNAVFGQADRLREQDDAAAAHSDEIEKVMVWAETLARQSGIAMQLPHAL
jgi:hypothetical protein